MSFPEEKMQTLQALDRAFDPGTRENFVLNWWLLGINIFLLIVLFLDLLHVFEYVTWGESFLKILREFEIIIGMLFLVEFTLRSIFVYIPDKKFITWYPAINIIVIISLLAPHFIGNLAILKFVKILKALKVYKLGKDNKKYNKKTA